jgi:hypothetical protein
MTLGAKDAAPRSTGGGASCARPKGKGERSARRAHEMRDSGVNTVSRARICLACGSQFFTLEMS